MRAGRGAVVGLLPTTHKLVVGLCSVLDQRVDLVAHDQWRHTVGTHGVLREHRVQQQHGSVGVVGRRCKGGGGE